MSEYLCKPESCDGTGDDPRCPHCVAFKSRVPAPSEDAVGVAREALERLVGRDYSPTLEAGLDALIAAVESRVRAECADRVRGLPASCSRHWRGDSGVACCLDGEKVLAALEAK